MTMSILQDLAHSLKTPGDPKTTDQAVSLVEEAIFSCDKIWDNLALQTQRYLKEQIDAKNKEPDLCPTLPEGVTFEDDDPVVETEKEKRPRSMDSMQRRQMLYSAESLISMRQKGRIKIPAIQRQTVWAKPKQQNFIVSMLQNIPIPSLLLAFDPSSSNERSILDGLQRLTTMIRFHSNLLKLGDHWPELKGKKFEDLDKELQNRFLDYDFAVQDIGTERVNWPYIFRQINTGGTAVNAMETRRATFLEVSEFMRTLDEFADKNKFWENVHGKNTRYKGLAAATRAVAMHYDYNGYSKPAEQFLDRFCSKADSKIDTNNTLNNLERTAEALHSSLQRTAFKLQDKQVNTGLVDSLVHASMLILETSDVETQLLGEILADVRSQFLSEVDMNMALTNNTSSKANVISRMRRIEQIALGVASDKGVKAA